MPRCATDKASKKAKAKASAARSRATPWSRTDPLLGHCTPRDPLWLHRLAISLLSLYAEQLSSDEVGPEEVGHISILDIMAEVDKYLKRGRSGYRSSRTVRLRYIRDALSSFEDKDFLEWNGLESNDESDEAVKLAAPLLIILDELHTMATTQMDGIDFSSLTTVQHRALGMWFRGLAKELGLRNPTKHDLRKVNDALKKSIGRTTPHSSNQPHENGSGDTDVHMDPLSEEEAVTNQNAVAGPSQPPQTPGRSRVLNTALAYPTPESRPRKNRSALYDDAAQAGPRIGAVSLPTPADTDSDSGDFQDALEEMVVDETPLTNQERDSFLQQISEMEKTIKDLRLKNVCLKKENLHLANEIQGLRTQLKKERNYLFKKLRERRTLQAVENAKWLFVLLGWRGRNARIEQLDDEITEARSDITWYKSELSKLQDLVLQKEAEMAALRQTVAEQAEQLRVKEELLQSFDSFSAMFKAKRQQAV